MPHAASSKPVSDTQGIMLCCSLFPAFSHLPRSELQDISSRFRTRRYRAQETILQSRESSDQVYFIASGSVRTRMASPFGKEIYYQDLHAGEMFGELSAIDGLPRTTDVAAIEDTTVLLTEKRDFIALLDSYPALAHATLEKLAHLVRFLCDRVYQYSALDVSSRVRAELISLAESRGRQVDQHIVIDKMPTHQDLANMLATHREAVTRELGFLEKQGIVVKQKHHFTILDMHRLKALLLPIR